MKKVLIDRGTVNADQGGEAHLGPQPIPSREGMGRSSSHPSNLGTRNATASRLCLKCSSPDPRRSHGKQASGLGLFGIRITGDTGSAPKAAAVRPIQQIPHVWPVGDDRPKRIGGLSFGYRRALVCRPSPAEIERRNAAMRAAALASDLRREHEWRGYAGLVESHPALPYGRVETACALND